MRDPEDNDAQDDLTDFGFNSIPRGEKQRRVAQVFDSVAPRYDLMNDLMSFGVHRLWKTIAVRYSGVSQGQIVLDLAGGSGDLAARFSRLVGEEGKVVMADINYQMLTIGRDKLRDLGLIRNLCYVQADAEALPFADHSFDCVATAFGLRNMADKMRSLKEALRILKLGGRLVVLEFSRPGNRVLRELYDLYSFRFLPLLGDLVANDRESYNYLVESIRRHPDQKHLAAMLREVGFADVSYRNLSGGIVALHRGYKF